MMVWMFPITIKNVFLVALFFLSWKKNSTPFAEGVRCYVCPNPGSIERTCLPGNVSNIPTNEIIEECTNGCYEKFLRSHSNTTISRGCERHYGPLKCWDVDGCEDLATDKKHFCSCGTNLCNKNLACFKGERHPPTISPSVGNPVVAIFSFFFIITAITLI